MTADTVTTDSPRIASRNATTHGLFARDVVLPRLGEDPQAYEAFLEELTRQLAPKNLLEQHYAEKIAAASWRLRRLHRWQAQLFEDMDLMEDEALARLDRVMRHETTLHRQIDTSVKMLGRELPRLFEGRVREDLIRRMNATERDCREDPYMDQWITEEARKRSALPTVPPSLDLSRLDTARQDSAPAQEKCENEPAACTGMADDCTGMACHAPTPNPPAAGGPCEARNEHSKVVGISAIRKARRFKQNRFCQNEPAPYTGMARHAPTPLPEGEVGRLAEPEGFFSESPAPPELGAGRRSFLNPLPSEGEGRRLAAGLRGTDTGVRILPK